MESCRDFQWSCCDALNIVMNITALLEERCGACCCGSAAGVLRHLDRLVFFPVRRSSTSKSLLKISRFTVFSSRNCATRVSTLEQLTVFFRSARRWRTLWAMASCPAHSLSLIADRSLGTPPDVWIDQKESANSSESCRGWTTSRASSASPWELSPMK